MRWIKCGGNWHKATGHISAVLKGVLFTGICIQTVMGIVWMCCNFPHIPQFGESLFYMQVSRTLRCDEYTGILYPVFLWIVRRNHYVVYAVQLAAAYAAARRFLRVLPAGGKWRRVWGSLALMTIPIVMQCHMAMLPCSFVSSLMLLELSLLTEAVRKTEERTLKKLAELSICWLALALLLPEYLYLGAIPVALFGVCCYRQWRGHRRIKYYGLLLMVAFAGMIVGINSLTQTRGAYGRLQKTPLMILTQRISWTSVLKDYESWPWQIIYDVSERVIVESAAYADGMDRFFFPVVEQAVEDRTITRQRADEYYRILIETAWKWHKSVILKEMAWDALGYGASPAVLQIFLTGRGYDTYSNRNYDFFLENTPGLSKAYMDYGSWWFIVAAVLSALLQVMQLPGSAVKEKKETAGGVLCCLTAAGAMILWYTMRGAGMQDYKNTILVIQLWMAWPVLLVGRKAVVKPAPAEDMKGKI